MKFWNLLCMFPVFCTFLQADLVLQPIPDLKAPSDWEAPRVKKIDSIAEDWWLKKRGLLAGESMKVAGYFSVTRPIKGFAERDDIVWEVRVIHLVGSPTGILWINEKTQKVIGLGLDQKL